MIRLVIDSSADFSVAEMKEKNYFVPDGKTKVALTKLLKKKYGI